MISRTLDFARGQGAAVAPPRCGAPRIPAGIDVRSSMVPSHLPSLRARILASLSPFPLSPLSLQQVAHCAIWCTMGARVSKRVPINNPLFLGRQTHTLTSQKSTHSRNSSRVQMLCVALIHVSWPLRIISTNQFGGRAIGKLPRKSALLSSRDTRILRPHCIPPPASFQVTRNATAVAQSHQISRMVFGSTPYCCATSVLCGSCGPCLLAFSVGFCL